MNKDEKSKLPARAYMLIGVSTAFLLAAPVIILLFLGIFLDNIFHTAPFIALVGAIIGAIGGINNVLKIIKVVQNPEFKMRVAKEKQEIQQKNKLHS